MPEIDPYAVLGVPRAATRDEIARAYRRLAKEHHPDAGAAPSPTMGRINDAWYTLSDAARRARWDRDHALVAIPSWTSPGTLDRGRPTAQPEAPPSRFDSGWVAFGVVGAVVVLVGALMIGLNVAVQPADTRLRYADDQLSFAYPGDWILGPGVADGAAEHRVIAHLVTFGVEPDQLCTDFSKPCTLTGDAIPPGEASILITGWEGGAPPIPEPVVARPFGLDADAIIGGQPAAIEVRSGLDGTTVTWWQLSPPDFPDRWIEVLAESNGPDLDRERVNAAVAAVLDTIEFED